MNLDQIVAYLQSSEGMAIAIHIVGKADLHTKQVQEAIEHYKKADYEQARKFWEAARVFHRTGMEERTGG